MGRLKDFEGIEGTDFFAQDRGLHRLLGDLLPADVQPEIVNSLHDCAARVSGRWNHLATEGSRVEQLPRLIKEDRVGNPLERVEMKIKIVEK